MIHQKEDSMIRIWRNEQSHFDSDADAWNKLDNETYHADAVYTDAVLAEIAQGGFNAIWVHAQLHNMVWREEFPELGQYAVQQQEKLQALIARSARYSIKVFLYMQPPRGIDDDRVEFWAKHREVAGAIDPLPTKAWGMKGDKPVTLMRSLCTSTSTVRNYLRGGFSDLARILPDLGGYIIISASEFSGHCCVREQKPEHTCRRCAETGASAVIANLLSDIYHGIRDSSQTQQLIAWDWSWKFVADPRVVIRNLPSGILFMSDTDRGDSKMILGKERPIDEYCLSLAGVSKGFDAICQYALGQGLKLVPKLQIGTTHELNSVPNLPLIPNVFAKACWFVRNKCENYLGCWNFGNMPSANTAAFNFFLLHTEWRDAEEAMKAFAEEYFPGCDGAGAVRAWQGFCSAMDSFPYDIPWLYQGPQSWCLGFFVPPGPFCGDCGNGFREEPRGDDISGPALNGIFTLEERITGMDRVATGFEEALPGYRKALATSASKHATLELATAEVCAAAYRSAFHMLLLFQLKKAQGGFADGDEYLSIQRKELAVVRHVLPFVESDSRQGYNPEAHAHLFDAARIREKIRKLENILNKRKKCHEE